MTIEEIEAIEWNPEGVYTECVRLNSDNLEKVRSFIEDPNVSHQDKLRAARHIDKLVPILGPKCGYVGEPLPMADEELLELIEEGFELFKR